MSSVVFLLGLLGLGAAVSAYARNWIGVAVLCCLPIAAIVFFLLVGIQLNSSKDADQAGVSAMLALTLMLPFLAGIVASAAVGWLIGVGVRAMRRTSEFTQETFE